MEKLYALYIRRPRQPNSMTLEDQRWQLLGTCKRLKLPVIKTGAVLYVPSKVARMPRRRQKIAMTRRMSRIGIGVRSWK